MIGFALMMAIGLATCKMPATIGPNKAVTTMGGCASPTAAPSATATATATATPSGCSCESSSGLWPSLDPAHDPDEVFTVPDTYDFTALSTMCVTFVTGFVNPDHSQILTVTAGPTGTEHTLFSTSQIDVSQTQTPNVTVESGWIVRIVYTSVDPEDPTPWVTIYIDGCTL